MPPRQISLQNWGEIELEKLLAHYGHDHSQEGSKFFPFVDVMASKREFLAFKLQATIEWGDKTYKDLWAWSHGIVLCKPDILICLSLLIWLEDDVYQHPLVKGHLLSKI